MPVPSSDRTSATLLMRLARSPSDQSAWGEFVARYGPQMQRWCRRWGLQDADADDVTQRVLLDLARQLPEFSYDRSRSFRAWLKTISHRAWQKYAQALVRPGQGSGDTQTAATLASVEARDDLTARLEKEFDLELLESAMSVVQQQVQPGTWEAFRLLALEHLSGAETAARLGLSVDAALKARSNVTRRLREAMRHLSGDEQDEQPEPPE
jgi:RNA polymerase sigma-70 factor (ECF subfamily)